MKTPKTRIDGPDAYQTALRKARFGHRAWIWWRDADGAHADYANADSIKAMLLCIGTKGNWTLIETDGTPLKGYWYIGLNVMKQFRMGWR